MATNTWIRHANERRVLSALREAGTASRTELATALGLRQSTLTGISGTLLESGLIKETNDRAGVSGKAGRPAVRLGLNESSAYFAGLEIGHTVSTAVVVDLVGREVARATRPTRSGVGPAAMERSLTGLLNSAMAQNDEVAGRLAGIGVAVPGVVKDGMIIHAPGLQWSRVEFGRMLRDSFDTEVLIENDANAAVLSETEFGVGRKHDHVAYVLLDHGVGLGLVLGGALYRGRLGWAGEAGHLPVSDLTDPRREAPSLERLIGIDALLDLCARAGSPSSELEGIVSELEAGAKATSEALLVWEGRLSWLLVTILRLLAPDLFVLGGRASALVDRARLDRLALELTASGLDCELSTATFGTDAVVMGAASLPMGQFFAIPAMEQGMALRPFSA